MKRLSQELALAWFLITYAMMERQSVRGIHHARAEAQPKLAKYNIPRIPAFKSTVKP